MSEVEKQESQKTVVAFITGLLIGGLLVWVFSSAPGDKNKPEDKKVETEQSVSTEKTGGTSAQQENVISGGQVTGKGTIAVTDQKAGKIVTLGTIEMPEKNGWVVVRDLMDGMPGNVLGAARYNSDEGLVPTSVELMRETTAGGTYLVSFYGNSGDADFSLKDDKPVDGAGTATFKAN